MQLTRNNTQRVDKLRLDTSSDHEVIYNTLADKSACIQNGEGTCDLDGVAYYPDQLAVVDDSPLQHTISFEQDPSCADRIRALLERKRAIKRRRKAAIKRYFPRVRRPNGSYYCPRYEWYIRHFSKPYQVWKYDGRYPAYTLPVYRWINTGRWVTLTHTEYAEHMLDELPDSNLRARQFWRTRLEYYRAHPRLGNSPYPKKWWEKTGGYWFVVDPGGHKYWKKRFKPVTYYYRDWPRIRQGWLTYRAAALKAIDVYNVQLANVEQQLAEASRGVAHYNACDAYADGGESLLADSSAKPMMLGFRPSDGDRLYPIFTTAFRSDWNIGGGTEMLSASLFKSTPDKIDCFAGLIDYGGEFPSEATAKDPTLWVPYLQTHIVPEYGHVAPGVPHCPSFSAFVRYDPGNDPHVLGLCNLAEEQHRVYCTRDVRVPEVPWEAALWHIVPDHGLSQRFHLGPSTRRAPIALEIKDAAFSMKIKEKAQEATMALLALRPDQAEIALNLTRSIGELKDLPRSVQSGAEFIRWTSAVVSTRGHPQSRYWEIEHDLGGGRTVTWVNKSPPSRAFYERNAIRTPDGRLKPGRLTVKRRQVTRKTSMAVLASLYLAWKFGVEQTLNDSQTMARNGWDWVLQVRRGLNIMLHRFRRVAKFITLRTVRNVSDLPWTGRIGSVKEIPYQKEFSYKDTITDRVDLSRVYNAVLGDNGAPLDYAEIQLSEEVTVAIPCILSDSHKFAFEDPRYSPEVDMSIQLKDGTYLSRDLCIDLLELYNERRLWDILSEEKKVPRAELYQRARIVLFARYQREQLKKAVDSKHMRNWLAWSQLTNTAWELFPCSFVIDWFVTTRQWVQSITDAIATWSTDVYPESRLWESIRNRIWRTPLEDVRISGAAQLDPIDGTRCLVYGSYALLKPDPNRPLYKQSSELVMLKLPLAFNLSYDYSIFWKYSKIKKTRMKRFHRAPVSEGEMISLPRVRCNVKLNIGKLSSLLAMFVSK